MCRIGKSFLVTEAERKRVRPRARFQQHRDASCHQEFVFPVRKGSQGNSRYSERNIKGTCTIVCHRHKLGGPVLTWWFFHLCITHLCWCIWRTFWSKTPREVHQGSLVLAQCPGSPGTCNPEETGLPGLPTSYHHPILRIWPLRATTCSMDRKKQLKCRHFSSDPEVIPAAETWLDGQISENFFEFLAKVRATG